MFHIDGNSDMAGNQIYVLNRGQTYIHAAFLASSLRSGEGKSSE